MGVKDWFTKPKEVKPVQETMKMPEYATQNFDRANVPKPSKEFLAQHKDNQDDINNTELAKGIKELYELIESYGNTLLQNQVVISEKLQSITSNNVTDTKTLSSDEKKYIPEQHQDTYLETKKVNPEFAQMMLQGYKSKSKSKNENE